VAGHLDRPLTAFDPVAARTALDQAGFPAQIGLYFSTNSTVGRVARDLQDQISSTTGGPSTSIRPAISSTAPR